MLADVDDIAKRAGALLDDPSNSIYTLPYLMPFIDQCYDEMDVDLERMGMQYIESITSFPVSAGTSDLTPMMQDGQPLATMKFPRNVMWKLHGEPDSLYRTSAFVSELMDYDNALGAFQWRFGDGALQVTKAAVDVTLRVYFDQMSTNMIDGATGVVRGTAHILALAVAKKVAGRRKGMEAMVKDLALDYRAAWNSFKSLLVMNNQGKQVTPPPMHGRRGTQSPVVLAPTS